MSCQQRYGLSATMRYQPLKYNNLDYQQIRDISSSHKTNCVINNLELSTTYIQQLGYQQPRLINSSHTTYDISTTMRNSPKLNSKSSTITSATKTSNTSYIKRKHNLSLAKQFILPRFD